MDVWAEKYFGRATFVCVGCDGPDLAVAFAKRLQLSKCLLTYVDEANGPRWGQLGCSGFIVIDKDGKVKSPKTSAFLEVREMAFTHVETLLESMLTDTPAPSLFPGQHVELHGLTRSELNGTRGYVVEAADAATGRCAVETYFGKRMAVRAENLRPVVDEDEDEEGEEGDVLAHCDDGS